MDFFFLKSKRKAYMNASFMYMVCKSFYCQRNGRGIHWFRNLVKHSLLTMDGYEFAVIEYVDRYLFCVVPIQNKTNNDSMIYFTNIVLDRRFELLQSGLITPRFKKIEFIFSM